MHSEGARIRQRRSHPDWGNSGKDVREVGRCFHCLHSPGWESVSLTECLEDKSGYTI